jgi:hypothetical protein
LFLEPQGNSEWPVPVNTETEKMALLFQVLYKHQEKMALLFQVLYKHQEKMALLFQV